ncbi:DUF4297 domain-containing protein [Bacillus anthracis]|uniref:DUF4297 domain-containing protein n=1 Tax=Bacillus anthracis TaxID=1392 RepID=UPI0001A1DAFF|nr:DUF4297 domain-containing protein [Bacillus anthracis]EEM72776.1 hypothetical protein bthur0009_11220 [Bacillus thuringiensis serovar andalousiensis BGSC 4AW1]MEB9629239.1 DUF4297 domain-containing protein [Bacillus anthracis]
MEVGETLNVREAIVSNRPRENSGSKSANRFDYQKNWALCKLFEIHLSKDDYLIVFDYHEDIILTDSETNPQKITFYQIKTKETSHWNITDLVRPKKTKDSSKAFSKIGSLYKNKLLFKEVADSLHFVSNTYYNVELEDETPANNIKELCISRLTESQKKTIIAKLKKELELENLQIEKDLLYLDISPLSLKENAEHAKGHLVQFLEKIDPNLRYNGNIIYSVLFDEINRRNNYEWDVEDFEEIKKYKGIGKSEFSNMVDKIVTSSQSSDLWNELKTDIDELKLNLKMKKQLRKQFFKYETERMNHSNTHLQNTRSAIIKLISKHEENCESLKELMAAVLTEFNTSYKLNDGIFSEEYIMAIILMEFWLS